MPETRDIRISACIAPSFREPHKAIKAGALEDGTPKTHFWFHGGRGSAKSSFCALEVILTLKRDEHINAVIIRKVGRTMRDSVYAQMLWAIDILGVSAEFKATVSPMEIVYKPTGQRILFRGADDPGKMKSIKTQIGYIGLVWFEELDQMHGMVEIRNILQSMMRGGETFKVLYSYNPPKSRDSWVNREILNEREDRYVHQSNYLDVPRHWLGEHFFDEAEQLESENEAAYRHEYMGDITGTGGAIFDNVEIRTITDEEVEQFDRPYNGVDWGFFPDPWAFNRMHYDAARRALYIFDEASGYKLKNRDSAAILKAHLGEVFKADGVTVKTPARGELVICDSAEPKSISDYRDLGIDARPVRKGAGSVEAGMKWLQSLVLIVIDSRRCPGAASEFVLYEHEMTKDGEYISGYPDKNNHHIDDVRYGMSPVSLQRFSA